MLRNTLLIVSLGLIVNCGGIQTQPVTDKAVLKDSVALYQQSKSLWEASNIKDYEFSYMATGGCSGDAYPPVVITVKDNVVSSVFVPQHGNYAPVEFWPTIDKLYEEISTAMSKSPRILSKNSMDPNDPPVFDSKYGFPVDVTIGLTGTCDIVSYRVWDFK